MSSALKLFMVPFMICMKKLFWEEILNASSRFIRKTDQKGLQNFEAANKKLANEFFQIENQVQSYKSVKENTNDIESLKKDNEA